jgi:TatD DNase family protein
MNLSARELLFQATDDRSRQDDIANRTKAEDENLFHWKANVSTFALSSLRQSMILADTHTHLYLNAFDDDRDAMVKRALESGVKYMLLPHIDSETTDVLHQLSDQYPFNIFPMMGLHPTSVKENFEKELTGVEAHLAQRKYCAIGEVGIDLYWDTTFAKEQEMALLRQAALAMDYDLPLVIHTRNSMDVTLDLLESIADPKLRGVFHCFSGDRGQAERVIRLGFLLGIGGVLTFKNSGLAEVLKDIDLQHIVLETDAPFLAPVPHRGARNESAYTALVAKKLAEIKGTDIETVASITTQNAITLFNLPL